MSLLFAGIGTLRYFTGTSGIAHTRGSFETDNGNAGRIYFDRDPGPSYPKANLQGTDISGFFWSETTGWAEFTGGAFITPRTVAL